MFCAEPHLHSDCCQLCVVEITPQWYRDNSWYPYTPNKESTGIKFSYDGDYWIDYDLNRKIMSNVFVFAIPPKPSP